MCSACCNHSVLQSVLSVPKHVGHFVIAAGQTTIKAPGYLCGRVVTGITFCGNQIGSACHFVSSKINQVVQLLLSTLLSLTGISVKDLLGKIMTLSTKNQALTRDIEELQAKSTKEIEKLTKEKNEAISARLEQNASFTAEREQLIKEKNELASVLQQKPLTNKPSEPPKTSWFPSRK